jgi:glucuronate isomerase
LLCNILGNDIQKGILPADLPHLGNIVQNICYNNAKEYFNFDNA